MSFFLSRAYWSGMRINGQRDACEMGIMAMRLGTGLIKAQRVRKTLQGISGHNSINIYSTYYVHRGLPGLLNVFLYIITTIFAPRNEYQKEPRLISQATPSQVSLSK